MSQNNINSPNMGLIIPTVGLESGPEYATDVNTSLLTIDQHDHSQGLGVQITPAGLNINTSLPFNNNFATAVAGITFQTQGSVPAAGTVYLSGRDMYFVDGLGNNIPITANGAVAGTPGSIANLVVPASASYVSATGTFVFEQNTNIAANLDGASLLLRNVSPNSTYAVTLSAPDALTSNYNIKLPVLPASSKIMTIDNTGQIYSLTDVDTTTMQISSNLIGVKPSGIDTNQIKDGAVTLAKLGSDVPIIKSTTLTADGQTFVVPAGCTYLEFTLIGGGGGGAGGGTADADPDTNWGGAGGGGGAAGQTVSYVVTPSVGEVWTATIGVGGSGGGVYANGAVGGMTFLKSSKGVLQAGGGRGGNVPAAPGASPGGAGGADFDPYTFTAVSAAGGTQFTKNGQDAYYSRQGAGGGVSGLYAVTEAGLGGNAFGALGGTAGTNIGGGGGGAGGSTVIALGGNGGNGGSSFSTDPTAGTSAVANSGAGGGGGGGGANGAPSGKSGRGGGNGGSGIILIYYAAP